MLAGTSLQAPAKAKRLWCKLEVQLQGKTVATSVRELDEETSAQLHYSTVDVLAWDQELYFMAMKRGLYDLLLYMSATPDAFTKCHGRFTVYLDAPEV